MQAFTKIILAAALIAAPAAAQLSEDEYLQRMLSGGPMLDAADLQAAIATASAHPLGSRENPVRADKPTGQHAYLRRLRCADGRAPSFERHGNLGPGPYMSIVDNYTVNCGQAAPGKVQVVMDMYHPGHDEQQPVPGFVMEGVETANVATR